MTNDFPPPGSAGTRDLVVVTPSHVRVFYGDTSGHFDLQSATPVGGDAAVAVGRFGGVANDLLVTDGSPWYVSTRNDGDGSFRILPSRSR